MSIQSLSILIQSKQKTFFLLGTTIQSTVRILLLIFILTRFYLVVSLFLNQHLSSFCKLLLGKSNVKISSVEHNQYKYCECYTGFLLLVFFI